MQMFLVTQEDNKHKLFATFSVVDGKEVASWTSNVNKAAYWAGIEGAQQEACYRIQEGMHLISHDIYVRKVNAFQPELVEAV